MTAPYIAPMTNDECREAWAAGFAEDPPILFHDCSQTHLSIARLSRIVKFNGHTYIYIPTSDDLIRDDVLRWLMTRRKEAAKAAEPTMPEQVQEPLI